MSHFHRKPVVVPTDFSPPSLRAIQTAQTVVDTASDIYVVYVGPHADLISPYTWVSDPGPGEYIHRQTKRLHEWLVENEIVNVKATVRCGDPGIEICELAKELKSPLIVIPSHGHSGLKRVLLGSVAERVIRHAECSVLVLRRNNDGEAPEPVSGRFCPRKRVVVPIDFSTSSDEALEVAKELVDGREEIDVINVAPDMETTLLGSTVLTDEVRRDNRQETLERYLAEHGHAGMRAHALTGDPGSTICDYVNHLKADTVVIPSHGYHGLKRLVIGSTAERVVRHCSVPVLVLRRRDAE